MASRSRGRVDWLLLICGAVMIGVPAWAMLTAGGAVVAGHPAYLITLAVAAAVGLLLIALGLRRRSAGSTTTGADA